MSRNVEWWLAETKERIKNKYKDYIVKKPKQTFLN